MRLANVTVVNLNNSTWYQQMHSLITPPETFNFENVLKWASWMRRFVRHGEVSKLMKEKEKKQIYVFVHLWGIWVKMPFAHPYSTMKKALYIDVSLNTRFSLI